MSALLPKSLLSRLSALAGLGAPAAVKEEEEKKKEGGGGDGEEEEEEERGRAPSSDASAPPPPQPRPPLEILDDDALTLSLDHLPPRELAALTHASRRLRRVASDGDAWRIRFSPRLPKEVVARVDGSVVVRNSSSSCGWPSTYAALALSNLLRSPLEWDGVSMGMRAASAAASEAPTSSPAWRVTCHGGHGWDVERGGPAGGEEVSFADSDNERWPPALMPRSALASSRAATAAGAATAAAGLSSWLPRSLLLPSSAAAPPQQKQKRRPTPLSVAASFSWCELVQEVDLVFELLRATSWVSSSSSSSSASSSAPSTRGGEEGGEKEAKNDGGGGGRDGKGKNGSSSSSSSSSSRNKTSPNLCWTRADAEHYLDSSPTLVFSFSCASRKDCESSLSASLLALPDFKGTGPLPPYHGRADYDWKTRAQALAVSELPERAAPWGGGGGSKAGKWERATLPPLKLPLGTRRALVVLRSKDSRFWSGHYGAKIAAPVLAFAATDRELEDAEAAARETEERKEMAAAGRELMFAA